MSEPFSARLRAATWSDHSSAEQTTFLDDLTRGRLTVAAHAALTAQHYLIYQVLEEAAAHWSDDPVAAVPRRRRSPGCPRSPSDLAFLLGADWRDALTPVATTAEYTARLREIAFTWPGGFVAHHYNRYLGDLSGGQYVARALARAYGLKLGGDGLRFYAFDGIADLDRVQGGLPRPARRRAVGRRRAGPDHRRGEARLPAEHRPAGRPGPGAPEPVPAGGGRARSCGT